MFQAGAWVSKPQYALTSTPSVRQRYNNFFIHHSAKSRNENQCQGIIFAAGKGTTFNQISIPKLLGMAFQNIVLPLQPLIYGYVCNNMSTMYHLGTHAGFIRGSYGTSETIQLPRHVV